MVRSTEMNLKIDKSATIMEGLRNLLFGIESRLSPTGIMSSCASVDEWRVRHVSWRKHQLVCEVVSGKNRS